MSEKRATQTDEYLGGFLDGLKQAEDRMAKAVRAPLPSPDGRWTTSEHGVPITVTQPDDPAMALLRDGHTTKPVVHSDSCYICEDPEFAQMGLPLCRPCSACRKAGRGDGHIPADDVSCTVCDFNEEEAYLEERMKTHPHEFTPPESDAT
jgi:hypothetical protein